MMRAQLGTALGGMLTAGSALLALGGCQTGGSHRPLVEAPPACIDFTASIYFEAQSAVISREARDLINASARRAQGCAVGGVEVLGLADAPGDPGANLELSKKRADAVIQALLRRGFKTADLKVSAAGDLGAQTPAGQVRPLRRRADVLFHLSSKPPKA